MPVMEFGPDTNGWLKIEVDGQQVGTVVWVGDNSWYGYQGYKDGFVYWDWGDTAPFPPEAFTLTNGNGNVPPYSSSMMVFPNRPFAGEQTLPVTHSFTPQPFQTLYTVDAVPNNNPPTRFWSVVDRGRSVLVLQWAASADKPAGQTSFWPYSTYNMSLQFQPLPHAQHHFQRGAVFYPVAEQEVSGPSEQPESPGS